MADDPAQLDYAPSQSPHRRRIRSIALILLLIFVAPLMLKWTRTIFELQRIHRLYDRCAAVQRPPDLVTFDETDRVTPQAPLSVWDDFCLTTASSQIASRATLFIGELRNSRGEPRLVGVDLGNMNRVTDGQIDLTIRVFQPAAMLQVPRLCATMSRTVPLGDNPKPLRIVAGQSDPSNSAHFTIPYALGDMTGIIDGWLKDDDTVLLEIRP